MINRAFIASIFFFSTISVFSQKAAKEDHGFLYRSEFVGGLQINSNGWGGTIYKGIHRTAKKKFLFGLQMASIKHPKEIKTYNPYYEESKGYFYGKQNALIVARPFIGQRKVLFTKQRDQGVEVGYVWGLGPSIGMAKPVYLQIGYSSNNSIQYDYIRVEKYDPRLHHLENIYGRAPWTKGLNEIKFHPGVFAKFGLNFEYSARNEDGVKALEAGIAIDAYPNRIPMMADLDDSTNPNKFAFFSFYVDILFGKKYF